MKLLTRTRRGLAAGLTGALVAGALAGLAATPAQADATKAAGVLTWNVSAQFVSGFSVRQASGGASFDDTTKQYTWPVADVKRSGDGTTIIQHRGTITGGAPVARGGYSVTLADPVVELAADGSGELRATVSAQNPAGFGQVADQTSPTLVTVAEFDGATTVGGLTTAVPDWAGVLPTGSTAAIALGAGAAEPVAGKAFHPEFLGAITAGIRPWFWQSATASNNNRAPGELNFDATVAPSLSYDVVSATPAKGLQIAVKGKNFTKTNAAGQKGVYVILAPADFVIDFDDVTTLDDPRIAGAAYAYDGVRSTHVMGEDGSFDLQVPIEQDNVQPGTDYVLVTWAAHRPVVNPSQSTTTPVTIDWSNYPVAKAALKVNRKATLKKKGKATVTLTGASTKPTGEVTFTTKAPGIAKTAKKTVKVANGRAVLTLPKGKKGGRYTVTATYAGDSLHQGAAKQTKRFVVKAAGKTTVKVPKKATTKRAGKARIIVKGKTISGVAKARGKVKVTIKAPGKKKVKRTVKLKKNGKVAVKLPKAAKRGTYKVAAKYVGNKNYTAAKKKTARYKVR